MTQSFVRTSFENFITAYVGNPIVQTHNLISRLKYIDTVLNPVTTRSETYREALL